MRPLRLSITAFGPYAGTEVVDFDALTELGLFVVAGNNGAGKTTIFDALHYSLFGTLPGRRATYIRLKSDHADDTVECSVTLDFSAQGKYWRVERSPKQRRPKRRGTGSTEVDRRATLYQLDNDPLGGVGSTATAIANKIGEVDDKCRELVGLSGKQFERVALLPQGEFSRVLRESSTDRRELLRTLFSSEIFGDATTLLNERATAATAADRSVLDRLDHQQAVLAASVSHLTGQPIAHATQDVQSAVASYRTNQLGELQGRVNKLEQAMAQAAMDYQQAVETERRLQRRGEIEQEHRMHRAAESQHHNDIKRLELARAAVPVANLVRATNEQEHRHTSLHGNAKDLEQQLARALHHAGIPALEVAIEDPRPALAELSATITRLTRQLGQRSEAALRVRDLDATTNQSHGELRRVGNDLANLDEQMAVARARQRKLTAEKATLDTAPDLHACEVRVRTADAQLHQRTELHRLESQHQSLVRHLSELDTTLKQNQMAFEGASQARATLPGLQQKADAAVTALQATSRRSAAAQSYAEFAVRLRACRAEHVAAMTMADELWDSFIAGTAARVAEALVDDEPCPVCGSAEHPSPATFESSDQVVTQADVTTARSSADQLHEQVRQIQTEIESLHAVHEDIAEVSATEALADIKTAKAMALGAQTLADDARQAASQLDTLAIELEQNRSGRAKLDAELRACDERLNQLRGALGPLAHESVDTLQAQAYQAAEALTIAEQRLSRGHDLQTELETVEAEIETIGLGQLAADGRRRAAATQLAERQTERDLAATILAELDEQLAATGPTGPTADNGDTGDTGDKGDNSERRTQAARRASDLVGELATAYAQRTEAADGLRRARSLLDDRISQSPFVTPDAALTAYAEPSVIDQLEAQTASFLAAEERLQGQLQELAELPAGPPDTAAHKVAAEHAADLHEQANRALITTTSELDRVSTELDAIIEQRRALQDGDLATRRLERVAALVKGDNDRNTSLENWVLAAHLRDVVELANVRLARSTHQRFQLCVLDDGENKRGKWGLDLGVEDTVTGTRRPTAGLSGGELFQASLALALGLADAVMNQTAGVQIDALFIDEGFGSLDEVSVERAIDLLDELRDRGAMVGVITHVPALLDALPLGVSVVDAPDGQGSTIRQRRLAA